MLKFGAKIQIHYFSTFWKFGEKIQIGKMKIFNSKQKWFTYFQTFEILAPKNSKLKKVDFWRENSNCRDLSIHCAVFFSCNRKQWVFGFDQPLNNGCGWNHLQFFLCLCCWLILNKIIKDLISCVCSSRVGTKRRDKQR